PPWQIRCARFSFSTAGNCDTWLAGVLGRMESAADQAELVKSLAARWTKDITEPIEKLRAIQQKLAATFNFVDFDPGLRPAPRPAGHTAYGYSMSKPRTIIAFAPWEKADESKCSITGKITVGENGTYSGRLSFRSSGLFVATESLRSADAQRARAEVILHRVLP